MKVGFIGLGGLSSYLGSSSQHCRRTEIPAENGHATARGLARIYGVLAHDWVLDKKQLLSHKALAQAIERRCPVRDAVLKLDMSWALGFMPSGIVRICWPNRNVFGHSGYGGAFGCADTKTRLDIGWTMNFMSGNVAGGKRGIALFHATHAPLGVAELHYPPLTKHRILA